MYLLCLHIVKHSAVLVLFICDGYLKAQLGTRVKISCSYKLHVQRISFMPSNQTVLNITSVG